MKPRVFNYRDFWYVSFLAGYDAEFSRRYAYLTWGDAIAAALAGKWLTRGRKES